MKCPFCGGDSTRVLDSRPTDESTSIRRRRECESCGARFTTYERYERLPFLVVKKDGRREKFSREKLLNGLLRACEKRPISVDTVNRIVNQVENEVVKSGKYEVISSEIGEMIMAELKSLDRVAYVRFASVYKEFRDIDHFMDIIEELRDDRDR
ncbi:NrdR family transcriptional regulator [Mesotoga sp. SC_NapDC2]|jgi:transcriptional repressor NrdR|uniref:transcriptional regulator NrdR n=1 Tax=unclassified Mesotoga TaxID=1184398 RepID=UPI000AA88A31|nr:MULTISPECIES: transcriptional regulator NrdR [unclassified Mesotoga]PNQ05394.1 NrdR family transcriptional regulator [Mesotoga sp. SC_NapDC3]PXF35708.1 NrdR family transcriptional regulator [Mesotoga sp. SC_NapDC]RIZ61853.1 NrdR family transcriptional regulator [Mesotoga sp. SC_NapDC2]MDD3459682.1 transcriptional regulator NrdR [Mesotoga sp.]HAY98888.1 transcriptional regulator NrdR [Mesotoga sp.]